MKNRTKNIVAVGVLGGGQLARMLGEACNKMGISWAVCSEDPLDPASKITDKYFPTSQKKEFLKSIDVLTFESEFFDADDLKKISPPRLEIYPTLSGLKQLQNKLSQKNLLDRLKIPTASYLQFDGDLDAAQKRWPNGFMIKWAELGYDGKGTHLFSDVNSASAFLALAQQKGVACYVEEKVDFKCELSWIGCRSANGSTASWPVSVTRQKKGVCKAVWGPAASFGVPQSVLDKIDRLGQKLLKHLDWVGVLAIELFLTQNNEIMVNELAPRVHNTGHWTQHFSETSQFENHIRAVVGGELGSTNPTVSHFLMWNLLSPDFGKAPKLPDPPLNSNFVWYDKDELKPGRKMGHLNLELKGPEDLDQQIKKLEDWDQQWQKNLASL